MEAHRNSSPRADASRVKVRAASLHEAYRQVRREYGEDAEILGSRSVGSRRGLGRGRDREVEVTVRVGGGAPPAADPDDGTGALRHEVQRIEQLVETVIMRQARLRATEAGLREQPLASELLEAGASAETVRHLATRFRAEADGDPTDAAAFRSWLRGALPASGSGWEDFAGGHVFLGIDGCGRTELVFRTAARLHREGRRVLVLSVLPGHSGEVRRLQSAAAAGDFDAAVIQKAERLAAVADQFGAYDAVLVDLPGLDHESMAVGGALHGWLADNDAFHRHFVVPLDGDARDLADSAPLARAWNCDWAAVTRTDASRRWGKLLDLDRAFGLPWSLHRGRDEFGIADPAILHRRLFVGVGTDFEAATPASWTAGEEAE